MSILVNSILGFFFKKKEYNNLLEEDYDFCDCDIEINNNNNNDVLEYYTDEDYNENHLIEDSEDSSDDVIDEKELLADNYNRKFKWKIKNDKKRTLKNNKKKCKKGQCYYNNNRHKAYNGPKGPR